jgi:hypothetical protein
LIFSFHLPLSYSTLAAISQKARHIGTHGITLLYRIQDMLSVTHVETSQIPS